MNKKMIEAFPKERAYGTVFEIVGRGKSVEDTQAEAEASALRFYTEQFTKKDEHLRSLTMYAGGLWADQIDGDYNVEVCVEGIPGEVRRFVSVWYLENSYPGTDSVEQAISVHTESNDETYVFKFDIEEDCVDVFDEGKEAGQTPALRAAEFLLLELLSDKMMEKYALGIVPTLESLGLSVTKTGRRDEAYQVAVEGPKATILLLVNRFAKEFGLVEDRIFTAVGPYEVMSNDGYIRLDGATPPRTRW